jgi:hypothetical protein
VRAAPEFATRLQLDDNAIAVARRRVQYCDDEPYALADSYFPYELVRDSPIAQPDNLPQGANKELTPYAWDRRTFLSSGVSGPVRLFLRDRIEGKCLTSLLTSIAATRPLSAEIRR